MARDHRTAPAEPGRDHLEELVTVYRAAVQLEVDIDVGGDRSRRVQ
jgi:hypothetical protein